MSKTQKTGKKACVLVTKYEERQGRTVEQVKQGEGYDLKSTKGDDVRIIEVKADTGLGLMGKHAYALTLQEWQTFSTKRNAWLYIVYSLSKHPKLVKLQDKEIKLHQIKIIAPQVNITFRKGDREKLMQEAEDLG